MKNGRIFLILIGVILFVLVVITIFSSFWKKDVEGNKSEEEITPGEEITEEQERQTIISLYYINEENNSLVPEARVIDAKNLLENPYKTLCEYLVEGPKNEKLKRAIPEGTKVNSASNTGGTVLLDLSADFVQNQSEEGIKLSIYSIVNTLTELNDVNAIKILIDGEEGKEVEGTEINFKAVFVRQDSII